MRLIDAGAPRGARWLAVLFVALALAFPAAVLADAPTADNKPSEATLEDTTTQITLSGGDADGDNLTFVIGSGPSNGSLGNFGAPQCDSQTPSTCTETVDYTPDADVNGLDSFTYHVNDGAADSADATVDIAITAVNDAPSFTKGANQTILRDSGAQSITAWATAISAGATDESGQGLTFNVTGDTTPGLFSVAPAITSDGTLSYTPDGTVAGTTTITITLSDDGGVANGGTDTSGSQTFTITVNNLAAHNDDATVSEGGAQAVNVLANDNPAPNPQVALTITAVTQGAHGAVVITGGGTGLTYDPAAGFLGTDTFTYTIHDPGTLSSSASVVVHVAKDTVAPVTIAVNESLPTNVTMGTPVPVKISWSATDSGVGVASYALQQSLDGGAYTTVSLPSALTTSSVRQLTNGHTYRFRVRATDKNGNTSSYRYGTSFKVVRYQDNSTSVVYSGFWGTSTSSSYSGSSMHYAGTAGKTATLTTIGRDFAIVGPKSSTRGTFRVYVDGVLNTTVSEKATTTAYRRVLWSIHFATSVSHQIRIQVVGPARIDLDCFLVLR